MPVKVGDKFEIEISDVLKPNDPMVCGDLYKIKGFNTLVFDDYGLSRLQRGASDLAHDENAMVHALRVISAEALGRSDVQLACHVLIDYIATPETPF